MGHGGNNHITMRDGYIGKSENNNKGVSQGIPLSATVLIIYDGQMMNQYDDDISNRLKSEAHLTKIKSRTSGYARTQHLYKVNKKNNRDNFEQTYANNEHDIYQCGNVKFPVDSTLKHKAPRKYTPI